MEVNEDKTTLGLILSTSDQTECHIHISDYYHPCTRTGLHRIYPIL